MMNKKGLAMEIGEFSMYILFILSAVVFFLIYGLASGYVQQKITVESATIASNIEAQKLLSSIVNVPSESGLTIAEAAIIALNDKRPETRDQLYAVADELLTPRMTDSCRDAIGDEETKKCFWYLRITSPKAGFLNLPQLSSLSLLKSDESILIPGKTYTDPTTIELTLQTEGSP